MTAADHTPSPATDGLREAIEALADGLEETRQNFVDGSGSQRVIDSHVRQLRAVLNAHPAPPSETIGQPHREEAISVMCYLEGWLSGEWPDVARYLREHMTEIADQMVDDEYAAAPPSETSHSWTPDDPCPCGSPATCPATPPSETAQTPGAEGERSFSKIPSPSAPGTPPSETATEAWACCGHTAYDHSAANVVGCYHCDCDTEAAPASPVSSDETATEAGHPASPSCSVRSCGQEPYRLPTPPVSSAETATEDVLSPKAADLLRGVKAGDPEAVAEVHRLMDEDPLPILSREEEAELTRQTEEMGRVRAQGAANGGGYFIGGAPPVSSDEDRADEAVRLTDDELRQIVRHMSPMAPGHALVDLQHDVERILAARLAEVRQVEQERDAALRDRDAWRSMQEEASRSWSIWEAAAKREKARADALAACGTERVEWGVDFGVGGVSVVDNEQSARENAPKFRGARAVRRTVTEFAPIVTEWEPVDDDRARGLDGGS